MTLEFKSCVHMWLFFCFQAKVLRLLATTYFEWDCSQYLDNALKAINLANQVVIFALFIDCKGWNSSIYWHDNVGHINHCWVILDNSLKCVCFMFSYSWGCFGVPSSFFFLFFCFLVEKYFLCVEVELSSCLLCVNSKVLWWRCD